MLKKLARKLLLIGFLLLGLTTLVVSRAERPVHAFVSCYDCVVTYQTCYANCPLGDDLCRRRCDMKYSLCVSSCEP
jgi:hypothetical protein